jgi:hypothetical protein
VVELSTVDEGSLEQAVNAQVRQGWSLDGVQFAMRESSKRPSMAFVFFTRGGAVEESEHDAGAARERLRRIAGGAAPAADRARAERAEDERTRESGDPRTWGAASERSADPWTRLREIAEDGEEPS